MISSQAALWSVSQLKNVQTMMSYIIGVVSDKLLIGNKDKRERLKERRNYNKRNKESTVIIFLVDKK